MLDFLIIAHSNEHNTMYNTRNAHMYMQMHVNKLFNAHCIILKGVDNNNNLYWIAKAGVEIKSNQFENVLTHHNLLNIYHLD